MVTLFRGWEMRAIASLAPSRAGRTNYNFLVLAACFAEANCYRIKESAIALFGSKMHLTSNRLCQLGQSLFLTFVVVVWGLHPATAVASPLSDRLASFPQWESKPMVAPAQGELVYPDWLAGNWTMSSTLVEMVAPLAPDVTTPGFEGNRQFLQQPVRCAVRFVPKNVLKGQRSLPLLAFPTQSLVKAEVVSDRAYNGLSLARAYLGDRVFRVWTDARDGNRLITKFRDNRKLFSTAIGRAVEQPDNSHFIATELFQQFFQSPEKPYKNQVETTTAYTLNPDGTVSADQMTAVYLNPPHPKAFLAGDRPVALYRYRLEFVKSTAST